MAYSLIFDTETTGLDKPFCYDLGYVIMDNESGVIVSEKHFIIEQIWHNLPLFESAYYHEKRPLYVTLMRAHKAVMTKYGYAMQEMKRDIRKYNISDAYAYNSGFDDKVFTFNCDWYKCINPLDEIAVHDIWAYASTFITTTADYQAYCEEHQRFTDTGNYKGNAETVFQYIMGFDDFEEEHMGLMDSQIEAKILYHCISKCGATYATDYKLTSILHRNVKKPFTIKIDNVTVCEGYYTKKYNRNDVYNFKTN